MSTGVLFITARCDFKAANRALLELRDLEYDSGDRIHVVLSKSASGLNQTGHRSNLPETAAGSLTKENFDEKNEWAGASVNDVEAFILAEAQKSEAKDEPSLFLVVDDLAITEENVIIAERNLLDLDDDEENQNGHEENKPKYDFNKARFPWNEAYSAWCNLDIANVGFDELCDDETGPDEDGWWILPADGERGVDKREEDELRERRRLMQEFAADGKI